MGGEAFSVVRNDAPRDDLEMGMTKRMVMQTGLVLLRCCRLSALPR